MKSVLLFCLFFISSLFATITNEYASHQLLLKKIPIVDVRTPGEWRETGLVQGSIPIMFFDEKGKYDIPRFMKELQTKVDTTKPFALICRTGSRTKLIAMFLSKEYGYNVTNLLGGILFAKSRNIPIEPYK